MRRKLFLLLFVASAIPLVGILLFMRITMLGQQQELARNRLSSVVSGVIGFYDKSGTSVLNQTKALAQNDDLKKTLLLTDEIGFSDQAALIKEAERYLEKTGKFQKGRVDPWAGAQVGNPRRAGFALHPPGPDPVDRTADPARPPGAGFPTPRTGSLRGGLGPVRRGTRGRTAGPLRQRES